MNKKEKHFARYLRFILSIEILLCFSTALTAGIITLEPNEVITFGSTLTVRIALPAGLQSVEMEIAHKESGGIDKERIIVPGRIVKDGNNEIPFIDKNNERGKIEMGLCFTSELSPGTYVFRVFQGKENLTDSAMIEVKKSDPFLKKLISRFKESIEDTFTAPRYFKGETNHSVVCGDLFLMDGKNYETLNRLTDTGDCLQPAWSPSGKTVAYVRWINNIGQLWKIDLDKDKPVSSPKQMMKLFTGNVNNPLWSPDGKYIAFISDESIWVMDAEEETFKKIIQREGIQQLLSWSEDGKEIVFSASPQEGITILSSQGEKVVLLDTVQNPEEKERLDIWQVDINISNGNPKQLLYDAAWFWLPYLSPDGKILFFSTPSGKLFTREGENFTRAEMREDGFNPAWSFQGDRIVFFSKWKAN